MGSERPAEMTLVLTITNVERLENGLPTRLRLDRHGAVIGRSPTADWSLPDPQHYISSVHCGIDYRDSAYVLVDKSVIGHYAIKAALADGGGVAAAASASAQQQTPSWGGWQPQPAAAGIS